MKDTNKKALLAMGLVIGAVGVTGGILANKAYEKKKTLQPEMILENVKASFLEEGPIEGSWIDFTIRPLQKMAVYYDTFTGGITRKEDDKMVQYEFIADAHTGTVLDLYRV